MLSYGDNYGPLATDVTLAYNEIITNIGGGYDHTTGKHVTCEKAHTSNRMPSNKLWAETLGTKRGTKMTMGSKPFHIGRKFHKHPLTSGFCLLCKGTVYIPQSKNFELNIYWLQPDKDICCNKAFEWTT